MIPINNSVCVNESRIKTNCSFQDPSAADLTGWEPTADDKCPSLWESIELLADAELQMRNNI